MRKFRTGIDNYGLHPLGLSLLEILQWARDNGAEGVHFSGLSPEESKNIDTAYLKDLAQYAASNSLYLEWGGGQHIPFDTETWERKDTSVINLKAAEEAVVLGTRVVRSCSGGLMRWMPESPVTEALLQETAKNIRSQRQMLKDHNVILALETHFEFTTWELLRLFEMCETEPGDFLGVCLDTMNLLTMLEEPVLAAERILPWVVCTHIKDGAIIIDSKGLVTFPTEIGRGVVNLREIAERLASLEREIHLSVEGHGGSFSLPIFDSLFLSKFPDLSLHEFVSLIQMARNGEKALRDGKIAIVEREKWPEICESRLRKDIKSLRKLLEI